MRNKISTVSKFIVYWQTTLILSIVYYVIVVPMGVLMKRKRVRGWSSWQEYSVFDQ